MMGYVVVDVLDNAKQMIRGPWNYIVLNSWWTYNVAAQNGYLTNLFAPLYLEKCSSTKRVRRTVGKEKYLSNTKTNKKLLVYCRIRLQMTWEFLMTSSRVAVPFEQTSTRRSTKSGLCAVFVVILDETSGAAGSQSLEWPMSRWCHHN